MTKVFGLAGTSGSGKTTLALGLIKHFRELGLTIATIKHAHKGFDIDHPGKDSMRHRQAGANTVIVSSSARIAQIEERSEEATLPELLTRVPSTVDLVMVEGFKSGPQPKIEVFRAENGKPPLGDTFPNILAQATLGGELDLDDIQAVAQKALDIAVPLTHLIEQ